MPVGTSSCSAGSCHGGNEQLPGLNPSRSEYTIWNRSDPHAQAYSVLESNLAEQIAKVLPGPEEKIQKAHKNPRCLACHAVPAMGDQDIPLQKVQQGVTCEACHGPAEKWWDTHTSRSWRAQSPVTKHREYGMAPLQDLVWLARTCAECHVGAAPDSTQQRPLREVNHDMVAAGHPPLRFELAAYLANMPPHWQRSRAPDFEAHLWIVGQLVGAESSLALLEYRAQPDDNKNSTTKKVWPEFAEHDCFACHHDLHHQSVRRSQSRHRSTSFPRNTWNFAMLTTFERTLASTHEADDSLKKLVGGHDTVLARLDCLMNNTQPPRDKVLTLVRQARALLSPWPERAKNIQLDGSRLDELTRRAALEGLQCGEADWLRAAQVYLCLAALQQARSSIKENDATRSKVEARDALRAIAKRLAFPEGYRSPRTGPEAERKHELFRDLFKPFIR